MAELTTGQHLRAARDLIADPERWCKGRFGFGGDASCVSGALMKTHPLGRDADPAKMPAYKVLQEAMGTDGLVCEWNDSHSHPEVLAAFDRAIAACSPTEGTHDA